MNCWCGASEGKAEKRGLYEVTAGGVTRASRKQLSLVRCERCGTVRQSVPPYTTAAEQAAFYASYPPTLTSYTTKLYDHDRHVAELRARDMGELDGRLVLDVGSGSGAFVDEALSLGAEAVGCELAEYACTKNPGAVYHKRLEDVLFPTDSRDLVTCFDVLEHAHDPVGMLAEMFRIVAQDGHCVVEVPNAFVDAGKHHWKAEHLWFWTDEQLKAMVEWVGFDVLSVSHPLPQKTRITAQKPLQQRPKILLPPGIGDSYWSMIKLEAFLKKKGLGLPDLQIVCDKEMRHHGHQRAFPFLEMFPFAHASWETQDSRSTTNLRELWMEAYMHQGRTIFPNVQGCDYFLSYNGWLRIGAEMDDLDPDLHTNWYSPLYVSLEQERFRREMQEKYGPYMVFYFIFQGTYQFWTKEFPIGAVAEYINTICARRKVRPVLVGAGWDEEEPNLAKVLQQVKNPVNLLGQTTVEQAFGVMRGAEVVVGYPSGLTIMAAVLGCKTFIIWNGYYNRDFFWRCCPPDTRGNSYHIALTRGLTPQNLANMTEHLLHGGRQSVVLSQVPVVPRSLARTEGLSPRKKEKEKRLVPSAGRSRKLSPRGSELKAPLHRRVRERTPRPPVEPGQSVAGVKYSLIYPYHNALLPFQATMRALKALYRERRDLEVIVVEQVRGAPEPALSGFLRREDWPFPVKLERFPQSGSFNSAALYNVGARAAIGAFLVLTKPECLHKTNILAGMDREFERNVDVYVVCAAGEGNGAEPPTKWLQHSKYRPRQLNFCTALSAVRFQGLGGFDEAFVDGHCYEDTDWRDRVTAGLKLVERDDLIVCCQPLQRPSVPKEWYLRNRELYRKKHNITEEELVKREAVR